ncbi:hypothetical protein [Pararhodobacter zhoushanensis]|uniref:Uncharacterized protein n=1 Tax=Pararhodobacter zhoushanensis TaxID=2479545 RepID=A0ABT3H5I2_9RHOB|nr:hypothetical protein [Pararhodobacter zhoushanensis]MCW1935013.1 hypothetical protein [Pararhodobacter zhoushanensis]
MPLLSSLPCVCPTSERPYVGSVARHRISLPLWRDRDVRALELKTNAGRADALDLFTKADNLVGFPYQWTTGDLQPAWRDVAMADVYDKPTSDAA